MDHTSPPHKERPFPDAPSGGEFKVTRVPYRGYEAQLLLAAVEGSYEQVLAGIAVKDPGGVDVTGDAISSFDSQRPSAHDVSCALKDFFEYVEDHVS